MHATILAIDPGETTGMMLLREGVCFPVTVFKDEGLCRYLDVLESLTPSMIVIEKFHLSPSKAKDLAWNTFHTCEVIGIVKLYAEKTHTPITLQTPSNKAFAKIDDMCPLKCSRHEKDAYLHLWYFLRNNDAGRKVYEQIKKEALR